MYLLQSQRVCTPNNCRHDYFSRVQLPRTRDLLVTVAVGNQLYDRSVYGYSPINNFIAYTVVGTHRWDQQTEMFDKYIVCWPSKTNKFYIKPLFLQQLTTTCRKRTVCTKHRHKTEYLIVCNSILNATSSAGYKQKCFGLIRLARLEQRLSFSYLFSFLVICLISSSLSFA